MNLKTLTVAAALAVSGVSAANAASFGDLQLSYNGGYDFRSGISEASTFWSTFSDYFNAAGYSTVYQDFSGLIGTSDVLEGLSSISGGAVRSATGYWSGTLDFSSIDRTVTFGATTTKGGVKTPFSGSVTQVPGPEAGAGLGALAMGGLAFWMNRRRKAA